MYSHVLPCYKMLPNVLSLITLIAPFCQSINVLYCIYTCKNDSISLFCMFIVIPSSTSRENFKK